jgi:gamma-glutamylcyclotransferase (GGCT)/AIG2-like uncharacterized protein YtfP
MQALYFAYGSNLCASRLRGRVPSAVVVGRARLPGRRLVTDKLGRDGSGKANLREDPSATVWGVIYEIHSAHWAELDACERGYSRVSLEVVTEAGAPLLAQTYVSETLTADPVPYAWYKRLVIEGAREHGLPTDYIAMLEAWPEKPDPADPT